MRRIRKWLLSAAVAAALFVPLAQTASADPGDGVVPELLGWAESYEPGDGGTPGGIGDGAVPE